MLCLLASAANAFSVTPAAPMRTVARSAPAPRMQFGTGNFDDTQTEGFFLSPIPGQAKAYSSPGYEEAPGAFVAKGLAVLFLVGFPTIFAACIINV